MAAPAILTQGTTFTIENSVGTAVAIAGVQSVSGLGSGQASKIDVTTLLSTAKQYRMGLQDWGDFTMTFLWNPDDAGQAAMRDAKADQSTREMVVTYDNTDPTVTLDEETFDVVVLSMSKDISADGVLQGTATFGITGDIALADSTP